MGDDSLPAYTVRPAWWVRGLLAVALLASVATTVLFVRSGESLLWQAAGALTGLLLLAGLADAFLAHLTLAGGELVVRSNFRTKRVPLVSVEKVHRDDVGMTLLLEDGGRFDLPEWAPAGVGMQNRIRARVREARGAGGSS